MPSFPGLADDYEVRLMDDDEHEDLGADVERFFNEEEEGVDNPTDESRRRARQAYNRLKLAFMKVINNAIVKYLPAITKAAREAGIGDDKANVLLPHGLFCCCFPDGEVRLLMTDFFKEEEFKTVLDELKLVTHVANCRQKFIYDTDTERFHTFKSKKMGGGIRDQITNYVKRRRNALLNAKALELGRLAGTSASDVKQKAREALSLGYHPNAASCAGGCLACRNAMQLLNWPHTRSGDTIIPKVPFTYPSKLSDEDFETLRAHYAPMIQCSDAAGDASVENLVGQDTREAAVEATPTTITLPQRTARVAEPPSVRGGNGDGKSQRRPTEIFFSGPPGLEQQLETAQLVPTTTPQESGLVNMQRMRQALLQNRAREAAAGTAAAIPVAPANRGDSSVEEIERMVARNATRHAAEAAALQPTAHLITQNDDESNAPGDATTLVDSAQGAERSGVVSNAAGSQSAAAGVGKRGRGRPRKNPEANAASEAVLEPQAPVLSNAAADGEPSKRIRRSNTKLNDYIAVSPIASPTKRHMPG